MSLCNIHDSLQDQDAERYARDPANEAEDVEDGENKKYDCGRVVVPCEVDHGSANAKDDLQDPSNPYELLGKNASKAEVNDAEDKRDAQDERKQNDGVG